MTWLMSCPERLEDDALALEVRRLAQEEREATTQLIAALAEFDRRRLYLPAGCASLFTYCTQVLRLSEHAAYHRIQAARAARRVPEILDRIAAGDVTLTAVTLLAPHMTAANGPELLEAARHKSKREVERLVAALRPQSDVPTSVRKLAARQPIPDRDAEPAMAHAAGGSAIAPAVRPSPPAAAASDSPSRIEFEPETIAVRLRDTSGAVSGDACPQSGPAGPRQDAPATGHPPEQGRHTPTPSSPKPSVVAPIAADRYKVQFTISRETHDLLCRAQDLLRHVLPDGDPAEIFGRP